MKDELARKAAKWWADQLRDRADLSGARLDNPMAEGMALILQDIEREGLSTEKIDAFEDGLFDILQANIDGRWFFIGVDYHPDQTLCQAAKIAGLDIGMTLLPWKTSMHFKEGEITVNGQPI